MGRQDSAESGAFPLQMTCYRFDLSIFIGFQRIFSKA